MVIAWASAAVVPSAQAAALALVRTWWRRRHAAWRLTTAQLSMGVASIGGRTLANASKRITQTITMYSIGARTQLLCRHRIPQLGTIGRSSREMFSISAETQQSSARDQ